MSILQKMHFESGLLNVEAAREFYLLFSKLGFL
jgi:hypothetical protein